MHVRAGPCKAVHELAKPLLKGTVCTTVHALIYPY